VVRDWCITVNVGGGPGNSVQRMEGMSRWAQRVSRSPEQPAVVFAQEVPDDKWLRVWAHAGYRVTEGVGPRWRIRSALITHVDMQVAPLTESDIPSLGYHGSYLASARWIRPEGDIILVSAHASPKPAEPVKYGWPEGQLPLPVAREGGGDRRWKPSVLWDSDLVLATLLHIQGHVGPVVVGGDFNESHVDDRLNGNVEHGWGHEFFSRAREGGLIEISLRRNGEEVPTRGPLQLDHVLASTSLVTAGADSPEPHTDAAWTTEDPADLSDHAALWVPMPIPLT
jgi:hypothetical protein